MANCQPLVASLHRKSEPQRVRSVVLDAIMALGCESHSLSFQRTSVTRLLENNLVPAILLDVRRAKHLAGRIGQRHLRSRQRVAAIIGHNTLQFPLLRHSLGYVVAHRVARPTERAATQLARNLVMLQGKHAVDEYVLKSY